MNHPKTKRALSRTLILSALALSLCLAPLMAQDAGPKLSMWNRGVFNLYTSDGTTSLGPNWMGYTTDQGPYNSLTMDWAGKDVSWSMTAQWDGDGKDYHIYLRDYQGSFLLFNGLARLTAGKLFSNEYRFRNFDTTGFASRIADAETGILTQIFPTKALSFGVFLPVPVSAQGVELTWAHMNFGAQWTISEAALVKASLHLDPKSTGGREVSAGLGFSPTRSSSITLGYTFRDVSPEHAILLDAAYAPGPLPLHAFADLRITDSGLGYGGKLNAEYTIPASPFTAGASASYGDQDFWGLDGLDLNPYLRYGFQNGSVQIGVDLTLTTAWAYKLQFTYTVGF